MYLIIIFYTDFIITQNESTNIITGTEQRNRLFQLLLFTEQIDNNIIDLLVLEEKFNFLVYLRRYFGKS